MKHAAPVRRELATRTVFNVLGPLTNPAGARALMLGVYSPELTRTLAAALVQLGATRAYVVHGAGGIDELSPCGPNLVCEVENGSVREYELDPRELGVEPCDPAELRGGDPETNARALRDVLGGAAGGHRSAVLLNAAGGIAAGRTRARPPRRARARPRGRRLRRRGRAARRAGRVHAGGGRMRFADALRQPGLGAIAEFKRRSPSLGDIRPNARVEDLVPAYSANGAAAISVLVDERFAGSLDDLRAARAVTDTPLLAKGFFTEEAQLEELRGAGADAALLILRDLDDARTARLMRKAEQLGLDTLVEAHDIDELARAIAARCLRHRPQRARPLDVCDRPRRAARARRERALRADRSRRERDPLARARRGRRARRRKRDSCRHRVDARLPIRGRSCASCLSRPLVKVCGLTRQEDVDAAVEAGADMLGFILVDKSPRRAHTVLDVPNTALSVAVFVGSQQGADSDLVQIYPEDDGTVRGRDAGLLWRGDQVGMVLDQPWDGYDPDHWHAAAAADGRIVLAGGLSPENVRAAIDTVHPWAVDAASSLETEPGVKDHARVRAFVEEAHA